jgi:DNA invertase Pin-like site-specific DNA recombinase
MRQAALYLRVSTLDQTTVNQELELREVAGRMGVEIAKVYRDHGISGAKGRKDRPAFEALCKDAAKRRFDLIMAWSVDRLGRSLQDLVAFLAEIRYGSISICISKASTPGPQQAQQCFRCSEYSANSKGR